MYKYTIKGLIPPVFLPALRSLYSYLQNRSIVGRNKKDQSASFHFRPCHYHHLFIKTTGEIIPCCFVRNKPEMVIGHISDNNLVEKMKAFDQKCRCSMFAFRKAGSDDKLDVVSLNLELSLACQAKCAMCCVDAPSFTGVYEAYNDLEKIIQTFSPSEILVQGGEVLVQKKSIDFLTKVKKNFPSMDICLVTNGCVGLDIADIAKSLFSHITISFVGFQDETYRKIMGINLSKTILFAEEIKKGEKTKLSLKYLTTPINFHETNLFLAWGLSLAPERIEFSDAGTFGYINRDTKDRFWEKIMERTSNDVKAEILSSKSLIIEKKIILAISISNRQLFDIDNKFLSENGLLNAIEWNYG